MQNANPILFQDLIKMDNREFIGQSSANDGMFRTYWKVGDKTYFVVQFLFTKGLYYLFHTLVGRIPLRRV
jgi:hypothetical protein